MNKTAIVTGATSGIGEQICLDLLADGYMVVGVGRNLKKLDELSTRYSSQFIPVEGDVRIPETAKKAVEVCNGNPLVLVNNAGLGYFTEITEMTDEQWHEMIDVNLTGAFYFTREAARAMKTHRKGIIINIASIAGHQAMATGGGYNASKFGMVGFSEAMMLELRPYGIRVTAICPGSVETAFFNHLPPSMVSAYKMTASDISNAVRYVINQPPHLVVDTIILRPTGKQKDSL